MNYKKIYDSLIEKAKNRNIISEYKETHHIIPKSMGGCNSKENLVDLTAREHYIAHYLLMKIYNNSSMIFAFNMMHVNSEHTKRKFNSRVYEMLKKIVAKQRRDIQKNKKIIPPSRKGIPHSEETKKKMCERKHSNETKKKMSESMKGKNTWTKGLKRSDEVKKQISETMKKIKAKNKNE